MLKVGGGLTYPVKKWDMALDRGAHCQGSDIVFQ